jgi:hypothetical protein
MPEIRIFSEDEIRAIIRQELEGLKQKTNFETITQAEALKMFQEYNLPAKRKGYITLKRIIAEGVIKTTGRRVCKNDVQNYIQNILA